MSFSRPITSQPASTRRRTESEPTRPPAPVTIASGMTLRGLAQRVPVVVDQGVGVPPRIEETLCCPRAAGSQGPGELRVTEQLADAIRELLRFAGHRLQYLGAILEELAGPGRGCEDRSPGGEVGLQLRGKAHGVERNRSARGDQDRALSQQRWNLGEGSVTEKD